MRGLILLVALALVVFVPAWSQRASTDAEHVTAPEGSGSNKGGVMADQRQLVQVSEQERLLLLHNMADMMANVASILDGLAANDRNVVAKAAAANGMAMMQNLPSSLPRKFPKSFAQMAQETHNAFDQIAAEAKTSKSRQPIFKHLANVLQTCVACHAAYRFKSDH
ncbi:MAG TPA: hypothetical protein VFA48_12250 [Gammaproteobacteria bacterium]|nr:hypothetical protein [Gammaproteobacteria bacterium]